MRCIVELASVLISGIFRPYKPVFHLYRLCQYLVISQCFTKLLKRDELFIIRCVIIWVTATLIQSLTPGR